MKKNKEKNLSINDNRYQLCFIYRKNTFGFYSYQEAIHTFKKIFDKESKKNTKVLMKK